MLDPFGAGSFRYVALGQYIDEYGNAVGACVAKWLKDEWAVSKDSYRYDMLCVQRAVEFVRVFNKAGIFNKHIRVIVPLFGRFGSDSALSNMVYLFEPYLDNYQKCKPSHPILLSVHMKTNIHTGNIISGWYTDSTELCKAMQALSHFSYHISCGLLLLCDLQGARDDTGGAIITDPAILSLDMSYGSSTDADPIGIFTFFQKHLCNIFCDNNWLLPADRTRAW